MTAPSRGAEPAVAAKLVMSRYGDVVAHPAGLSFQMSAKAANVAATSSGCNLSDQDWQTLGKSASLEYPRRRRTPATRSRRLLGSKASHVKDGLPEAHTTRSVQKVRPAPNRVQSSLNAQFLCSCGSCASKKNISDSHSRSVRILHSARAAKTCVRCTVSPKVSAGNGSLGGPLA